VDAVVIATEDHMLSMASGLVAILRSSCVCVYTLCCAGCFDYYFNHVMAYECVVTALIGLRLYM